MYLAFLKEQCTLCTFHTKAGEFSSSLPTPPHAACYNLTQATEEVTLCCNWVWASANNMPMSFSFSITFHWLMALGLLNSHFSMDLSDEHSAGWRVKTCLLGSSSTQHTRHRILRYKEYRRIEWRLSNRPQTLFKAWPRRVLGGKGPNEKTDWNQQFLGFFNRNQGIAGPATANCASILTQSNKAGLTKQ